MNIQINQLVAKLKTIPIMCSIWNALKAQFIAHFPHNENLDVLADLVDGVSAGLLGKDEMIEWFELHKRLLEE